MSDVAGRRRPRTAREPEAHAADPWWGPEAALPDAVVPERARRGQGRRPGQQRRRGTGWVVLGLALAPFAWALGRARRSPVMRRMGIRALILLGVLIVVGSSVGVILVNNVVIGRTAELGELDDRRRELRRENAVLDDEVATLTQPPLIQHQAETRLGMVRATNLPSFIFLDPGSRTLTPLERFKAQQRERLAANVAAAQESAGSTATATDKETPG